MAVGVHGTLYPASMETDELLNGVLRSMRWCSEESIVNPLSARGSSRSFTRIWCDGRSAMVIRYGLERAENRLFAEQARFLAGIGMRVPAVLLDRPEDQLTVVEDLGATSLADVCRDAGSDECMAMYQRVLDGVLLLHSEGTRRAPAAGLKTETSFSEGVYEYERELFATCYLKQRLGMSEQEVEPILRELAKVAERLSEAPAVLVHRDLQSSNILVVDGEPAFIDFQGMRLGPAVYDLASLLCDPYMSLSAGIQSHLLEYYLERCGGGKAQVEELFWLGAIQRLCQALGAYVRLATEAGLGEFERFIPPALGMLGRALDKMGGCDALREVVRHIDE